MYRVLTCLVWIMSSWITVAIADEPPDCRYGHRPAEGMSSREWAAFQRDDVFRPLVADLKQPQFYAAYQGTRIQQTGQHRSIAAVSFGENFSVFTFQMSDPKKDPSLACNRLQIGILGAVFSQFDLGSASKDLVNADYVIGFPISIRFDEFSFRFRPFHQSSHVGDEFLLANLNNGFQRLNYSFEELELISSYDHFFSNPYVENVRAYAGGGWMFDTDPHFKSGALQWGAEIRSGPIGGSTGDAIKQAAQFLTKTHTEWIVLLGADFKQFEHLAWNVNSNVVGGLEGFSLGSSRRIRFLFNYYNGFNPYGQFFSQKISNIGFGIYLTL